MVEKLKRRKIIQKSLDDYSNKAQKKLDEYIERKIAKFYKLKSKPKVISLDVGSYVLLNLNQTKCDFKICNYYVYRIPTSNEEAAKIIMKIAYPNRILQTIQGFDSLRRRFTTNYLRSKYVYIVQKI